MTSFNPASTVLDSAKQKSTNNISKTNKTEKYKIIYNKKAESEFFVDNSALAGFTGERILYMAIRELLENALDSCESFSILPSITISLKNLDQSNDLWLLSCKDNGTGIDSDKLPVAVCSFLTSAKYMEKQQRGLFGVGLKMVAAFSTKDTDYPIKVWNKSINESEEYYFELRTDIGTNKPIVLKKKIVTPQESQLESKSGFKIDVVLRAKLVPITKNKIYEYVTQTSIVNPYSSITFETDDGIFQFDRRTFIMPHPAQEILPHPSDMDLKTLKKAISKFDTQKISLPKILTSSFQKLSYEKAKELVTKAGLNSKRSSTDYGEHDLIKIVNICKKTKFQNPNTDHLSPIDQEILTIGMMSEYTIVTNKGNDSSASMETNPEEKVTLLSDADSKQKINSESEPQTIEKTSKSNSFTKNNPTKSNFSVKVLKPVLTAYTSRTCVINNRPTIVETGLAYGGDIPSFKLYRFANKIPLLYDEGSDVAREVISEVEINKMGITKKQAKEQFSTNKESKKDRIIEVLPLHIFFHICSTKIPYKTAGKESIASEGELKYFMKSCLSELYRKLSTQIRKELKLKEAENKLKLYKHYLPFIVNSINESLGINNSKLEDSFSKLIENHLSRKSNIDENIIFAKNPDSVISTPVPLSTESKNVTNEQNIRNKSIQNDEDPSKIDNNNNNNNNKTTDNIKKKGEKIDKFQMSKRERNIVGNVSNQHQYGHKNKNKKAKPTKVEKRNDGNSSGSSSSSSGSSSSSIAIVKSPAGKTPKNVAIKKLNQIKSREPKSKDKQSVMNLYDKRVNRGKKK